MSEKIGRALDATLVDAPGDSLMGQRTVREESLRGKRDGRRTKVIDSV